MLSDFLNNNRESLIVRARAKVLQRRVPLPTDYELQHGVPLFLNQLIETLRMEGKLERPLPEMGPDAVHHAKDLFKQGLTIGQVVHDYGDLCQAVTELAEEVKAKITTDEFHTLNRCLDDVTAEAVTEYGRQRELEASNAETERLGVFAHELRNLIQAAVLSFQMLRRGTVGVSGSTGNAHERTLRQLCDLIDRTLAEVRLESKIEQDVRFPLSPLIEEVAFPANLEARNRGVELVVVPPEGPLEVEADRHLLASAISNVGYCRAIARLPACIACWLVNIPKTVGPEPLMHAPCAPNARSACLSVLITGYCASTTGSKSSTLSAIEASKVSSINCCIAS